MKMKVGPLMRVLRKNNKPILVLQGGTSCFVGNTLVKTFEGYKKIRDIKKGDLVLSFDEEKKELVFNPVIDKYIYKCEHTNIKHKLIKFNLKNGEIICTESHRFYSEGQWRTAKELARRVMERNTFHKGKLSNKQQRKNKDYELEEYWKREVNESRNKRGIYVNNNNNEQKADFSKNTKISGSSIYSKSKKQIGSKSQGFKQIKQFCGKSGMGDPQRKYESCKIKRENKNHEGGIKWDEQANRGKSNGNQKKIQTKSLHGKDISKRIWCFSCDNKGYTLQKKNLEACEIDLNDIIKIEFLNSKETVYDLHIKETKNYCITKENIIVHNSAKTWSILQFIIIHCLSDWDDKTIDIVRRTYPALRISVMADFFKIIDKLGIYSRDNHNKSEGTYKIRSNLIRFYSSDDEQKVRGPRRNVMFFNEILEFKRMDVLQMMMRTHELTLMDYNPSEEFHWVYDEILKRDDVNFHKSTYLDNPFLPEKTVKDILRLKDMDPNLWRIYGLGERGVTQATIFSNWDYSDKVFEDFEGQELFGLDFGFNNPSALVRVKYHKEGILCEQLIYKTNLTSDMVVRELEELEKLGKLTKESTIYGDGARPEMIEDIRKAGFNIHAAKKEKDSVLRGINFLRKHKLFLLKESVELIKEFRTYKWKVDKEDRVLDVPVDLNDHLIDGVRYALSELSRDAGHSAILTGGEDIFG